MKSAQHKLLCLSLDPLSVWGDKQRAESNMVVVLSYMMMHRSSWRCPHPFASFFRFYFFAASITFSAQLPPQYFFFFSPSRVSMTSLFIFNGWHLALAWKNKPWWRMCDFQGNILLLSQRFPLFYVLLLAVNTRGAAGMDFSAQVWN